MNVPSTILSLEKDQFQKARESFLRSVMSPDEQVAVAAWDILNMFGLLDTETSLVIFCEAGCPIVSIWAQKRYAAAMAKLFDESDTSPAPAAVAA